MEWVVYDRTLTLNQMQINTKKKKKGAKMEPQKNNQLIQEKAEKEEKENKDYMGW